MQLIHLCTQLERNRIMEMQSHLIASIQHNQTQQINNPSNADLAGLASRERVARAGINGAGVATPAAPNAPAAGATLPKPVRNLMMAAKEIANNEISTDHPAVAKLAATWNYLHIAVVQQQQYTI